MTLITPIIQRWIDEGRRDPDGLWARAADDLPWFRKWDRVFEWDPPTFRWFVGGETNLGYNAVDRHVLDGHGGRAALIYFNERGERVVQTYAQLLHQVKRIAAALRGLGIGKGDRITIYMPPCPESIALMLATVRIGAIHSIVFAGFGAQALGDRIAASGSRVVFAADVTYRKGQDVPLLPIVEEALPVAGESVERVVVLERSGGSARRIAHLVGRLPAWRRRPRLGPRGDGVERAGVHPGDLGHDGETEAGDSHARRLPGPRRHDGQVVLRPQADRRVVGDVGHRLDRRPQLHGVRAAARSAAPPSRSRARSIIRRPTPTGVRRSRSSASPASSRRRPRSAC